MNQNKKNIPKFIFTIFMVAGLFFGFTSVPLSHIKKRFFDSTDAVTFYVIGFLFSFLLIYSYSKYCDFKHKKKRCLHGVPGGRTQNLCVKCKLEDEERTRAKENAVKEKIHLQQVIQAMKIFRQREIEKVRSALFKENEYLYSLSPYEFENAIAQMYIKLGYEVQQTTYSNDRGKDGILFKDGHK